MIDAAIENPGRVPDGYYSNGQKRRRFQFFGAPHGGATEGTAWFVGPPRPKKR